MEQRHITDTRPHTHFPPPISVSLFQKLLTYSHQQLSLLAPPVPWNFKAHIIPHFIPAHQAPQCWTAGIKRCHTLVCTPRYRLTGKCLRKEHQHSSGGATVLWNTSHRFLWHHKQTLLDAEQELIRCLSIKELKYISISSPNASEHSQGSAVALKGAMSLFSACSGRVF